MFPPFDREAARHYCMELAVWISRGSAMLRRVAPESAVRSGQGVMAGALVCRNSGGGRTVLFALSGNRFALEFSGGKNSFSADGTEFVSVPPVVSPELIEAVLRPNDGKIHSLTNRINSMEKGAARTELVSERRALTDSSLNSVFSLYSFSAAGGGKISLDRISSMRRRLPPAGTGDCCAPKLLDYAFSHGLVPVSMDEFFLSGSADTPANAVSCDPCDSRCGFILPYMLGLEIIYHDKHIAVVNKPSGLLSVPGRGADKKDCVTERLRRIYPSCTEWPSVHRLDMETSGLMVLALSSGAQRSLSASFGLRLVRKEYTALLDGILEKAAGESVPRGGASSGRMELKFRLDPDNRPHQVYDEIHGKTGITEWRRAGTVICWNPVTGKAKKVTKVFFVPHTGRTHQLRLAAADSHGFGLPIVGDSLYGECAAGERLMLHASYLAFPHPVSGREMEFSLSAPF